jgi:hypothetical protein
MMTRSNENRVLAVFTLMIATILTIFLVWVVAKTAAQNELMRYMKQPTSPTQTHWVEPYGGCDEAWQAPQSRGARECRQHGYAVPAQ